jgi:predicted XRE-type DNA-binding protein
MIHIYMSGQGLNKPVPISDALDMLTDDYINDGKYCTQTILDLRDALKLTLSPDDHIKTIMSNMNLTQKDVAKMMGCTQANISMMLSGKRIMSAKMKEKLMRCLTSHQTPVQPS